MLVLESKYQGWQGLGGRVDGKNECMWWRDLKIVCGGVEQISWFGKVVEWNIGDGRSNFSLLQVRRSIYTFVYKATSY